MGVTNEDAGATTRRVVLTGAGAAGAAIALAACGTGGNGAGNGAGGVPAGTPASSAAAGGAGGGAGGDMAGAAIKTADIPVNGGMVYKDQDLVVTQPVAGKFEAFSATCPHAGCMVNKISNNVIHCPCHGSSFNAKDGSVKTGPATRGLTKKAVKVANGTITVT